MDIEIKTWLYDLLNAIAEIESFFADRPMLFVNYQADLRTKRAVERNIEIIGEAMNRIIKKDLTIKITSSRKLVDDRNHDSVSDEVIWGIVVRHIPFLKAEITALPGK